MSFIMICGVCSLNITILLENGCGFSGALMRQPQGFGNKDVRLPMDSSTLCRPPDTHI